MPHNHLSAVKNTQTPFKCRQPSALRVALNKPRHFTGGTQKFLSVR